MGNLIKFENLIVLKMEKIIVIGNIIDIMKLKNPELTFGNIRSKELLALLAYYKGYFDIFYIIHYLTTFIK